MSYHSRGRIEIPGLLQIKSKVDGFLCLCYCIVSREEHIHICTLRLIMHDVREKDKKKVE